MDTVVSEAGCGEAMHALLRRLFPICRSLTGDGVRETLSILREHAPITTHEVPSGTPCFDWTVPDEWNVRDAFIADEKGERVVDFKVNNLHLVSYSVPYRGELTLEELKPHLHTLPEQPDAIPYITSYYHRDWGFCLTHQQYEQLSDKRYEVVVDTDLSPGSMSFGELILPGETDDEILLATNICHPSMANNELSGPVVVTYLARWLAQQSRRHTYRLLFLPETIGAISYLSRHLDDLRDHVVAGYQVVCVGGPGSYVYISSRGGNSLTDRLTNHVLHYAAPNAKRLDFRHRASDERQWCSPGADLPVGVLTRTPFHAYDEYHTSKDDETFVTPSQLVDSLQLYQRCIEALEKNICYRSTIDAGEPQLGRRGLYPTAGGNSHEDVDANRLLAIMARADGETDLLAVAEAEGGPIWDYYSAAETLMSYGLVHA